ncbi:integrase [Jeongeupia sp. HS-3]|nr:integrase [Jeongeupia sp. HS-3]
MPVVKGRGRFRSSSADVYRAQWHKFIAWLEANQLSLRQLSAAQLVQFLGSLTDVKRQQRDRYLRIIERIFDFLAGETPDPSNPARVAIRLQAEQWRRVHSNDDTGFLSRNECADLCAWLAVPVGADTELGLWRQQRDRALVAVLLGAGLKLAEAQRLTIDSLAFLTPCILSLKRDDQPTRQVALQAFAVPHLNGWLIQRQHAGTAGDLVFPADLDGRMMHPATILRATRSQVAASGIATLHPERISPQTLRNSFAASLFEQGEAMTSVARQLGFVHSVSAERLHTAWLAWCARE